MESDKSEGLSGWLEKRGKIGIFVKKWATLNGAIFKLYRDEAMTTSEIVINVQETTKIHMGTYESGKFCIEIEGSDELLFLRAPSPESMLQWIHALRSCTYTHNSLTIESFRILSVLGRGNYGKVVLGEKLDTGEVFAIKSIHKKRLSMANKVHTILSERNTLINASNPFIVKLHYAFQNATKFYLVLEYVAGGEMFKYMSEVGSIPLDDVRIYAAEIVTALHFLHENDIIYRDLKPENILLNTDGHIKLTDFGFAKDLSQSEVTKTFCGTNEYLAPEVISRVNYGPGVDWWTLGILLYEMLFQITPFFHQNTSRLYQRILMDPVLFPPGADPDVCSLITGLLQKRDRKRFKYEDIIKHPFFKDIDWDKVLTKSYVPSYKPPIKNKKDVSNFDQEFTAEPAIDSVGSTVPTPIQRIADFSYVASVASPMINV